MSKWKTGVKYSELGTKGVEGVMYATGDEIEDASFGSTWVRCLCNIFGMGCWSASSIESSGCSHRCIVESLSLCW